MGRLIFHFSGDTIIEIKKRIGAIASILFCCLFQFLHTSSLERKRLLSFWAVIPREHLLKKRGIFWAKSPYNLEFIYNFLIGKSI